MKQPFVFSKPPLYHAQHFHLNSHSTQMFDENLSHSSSSKKITKNSKSKDNMPLSDISNFYTQTHLNRQDNKQYKRNNN